MSGPTKPATGYTGHILLGGAFHSISKFIHFYIPTFHGAQRKTEQRLRSNTQLPRRFRAEVSGATRWPEWGARVQWGWQSSCCEGPFSTGCSPFLRTRVCTTPGCPEVALAWRCFFPAHTPGSDLFNTILGSWSTGAGGGAGQGHRVRRETWVFTDGARHFSSQPRLPYLWHVHSPDLLRRPTCSIQRRRRHG